MEVILNHFDSYPLITQKLADYILFKQVVLLMKSKEHLTTEGLNKIVSLRAALKKGLSDDLKAAFPSVIPNTRPIVEDPVIKDPNWVAGFATGEACFFISITKSLRVSTGAQTRLRLEIGQHSRDELLLKHLIDYLGCGLFHRRSDKDAAIFFCYKFLGC